VVPAGDTRSPDTALRLRHNVAMQDNAVGAGVRELLGRERDERPMGGWGGEWVPPPAERSDRPEPPQPLVIPEPDWEQEERERLAREAAAELKAAPKPVEPEPERYPAKPRKKAKRTPNLDTVRAWRKAQP
jgi:hypothetical protein